MRAPQISTTRPAEDAAEPLRGRVTTCAIATLGVRVAVGFRSRPCCSVVATRSPTTPASTPCTAPLPQTRPTSGRYAFNAESAQTTSLPFPSCHHRGDSDARAEERGRRCGYSAENPASGSSGCGSGVPPSRLVAPESLLGAASDSNPPGSGSTEAGSGMPTGTSASGPASTGPNVAASLSRWGDAAL
jgi:hypothetical protein